MVGLLLSVSVVFLCHLVCAIKPADWKLSARGYAAHLICGHEFIGEKLNHSKSRKTRAKIQNENIASPRSGSEFPNRGFKTGPAEKNHTLSAESVEATDF
jgi:hypothetical protein